MALLRVVDTIQSVEDPNKTKKWRKGEVAISACELDILLLPTTSELLALGLSDSAWNLHHCLSSATSLSGFSSVLIKNTSLTYIHSDE